MIIPSFTVSKMLLLSCDSLFAMSLDIDGVLHANSEEIGDGCCTLAEKLTTTSHLIASTIVGQQIRSPYYNTGPAPTPSLHRKAFHVNIL